MFLRWFFPSHKKNVNRKTKVSWEASQFLYYIWREISDAKPYKGKSIMVHTSATHFTPIKQEVEDFLIDRGYDINYFEGVCGKFEIIVCW